MGKDWHSAAKLLIDRSQWIELMLGNFVERWAPLHTIYGTSTSGQVVARAGMPLGDPALLTAGIRHLLPPPARRRGFGPPALASRYGRRAHLWQKSAPKVWPKACPRFTSCLRRLIPDVASVNPP
jgi:hypothetical protein